MHIIHLYILFPSLYWTELVAVHLNLFILDLVHMFDPFRIDKRGKISDNLPRRISKADKIIL